MAGGRSELAGGPGAAREARGAGRPVRLSLRAKGIFAFVALVCYVFAVGALAAHQRDRLQMTVEELERVHALEERLTKVNTSVAHTILKLQEIYYSGEPLANVAGIALDVEAIQAGLQRLRPDYRTADDANALLENSLARLQAAPARGALAELRGALHALVERLDEFTRSVRDRKDLLAAGYRNSYDAITAITLIGALLGVVMFGALVTLFFTRLAWDLRRLEARSLEVVTGYRGAPLGVTRSDEIGGLMESVNRMQSALRDHEQQLEIARQQRFHQDKMAAVGSLAAAVAHEISNPIAAIQGVAQIMNDTRHANGCAGAGAPCQPALILEQARRIAEITRQMSEMTARPSSEPQLIDVNGLVRSTCNFVGYDRRFRRVQLALDLDSQLPAVMACADHLTQVLMNLLINAGDAIETAARGQPEVRVATAARGERLEVTVSDNGCGMDEATVARAFEETFTTKKTGRGNGLGLFICKSLVESAGGSIRLASRPGAGTRVSFTIPFQPAGA